MQSDDGQYLSQSKERSKLIMLFRVITRKKRYFFAKIQSHFFGFEFSIGRNSHIGPRFNIRSAGNVEIDSNVNIGSNLHLETNLFVGKGTLISSNVSFVGNDHSKVPGESSKSRRSPQSTIYIGENCWIGFGSIIVGNRKIASDVIIGAGSVVVSDIQDSGTYAGVPARKITKNN